MQIRKSIVVAGAMLASGSAATWAIAHPGCGGYGYGGYGYGGVAYGGYGYGSYGPGYASISPYAGPYSYGCGTQYCQPPAYSSSYSSGYQQTYYSAAPRQYYTLWQYDASRACYSCYYEYLPTPTSTAYNCHEVIYFAGEPNHYYYFNPYKRKFWGRAPVHHAGVAQYSRLTPDNMREQLAQIPQSAFPAPGPMPAIPESTDGVAMIMPQGGGKLTPDVLASVQGEWRTVQQDTAGRRRQIDMTIRPDGASSMTNTIDGALPQTMLCRYSFDDTSLKMVNSDYGEVKMQIASVGPSRLELAINNQSFVFQRP